MQLVQEIQWLLVQIIRKSMWTTAEDYTMIRLDEVKEYSQYNQTAYVDHCQNDETRLQMIFVVFITIDFKNCI